mgnify:CR=1 FL=1
MVQVPDTITTLEEFLKLPETEPASEYFDGQIIQKPMPQTKHSRLQTKLAARIDDRFEVAKIALAFTELRCTFGGKSIIPDISVFTWDRLPISEDGLFVNGVQTYPDWFIEILSPDQGRAVLDRKISHGLKHGCQMGWLIDPEECYVMTYPAKQAPNFFDLNAPDEILSVPAFASELNLTVGALFGWLRVGR